MGGLSGGHYIAHARNLKSRKWYQFDDSYVSEVAAKSIVSNTSYVLFYARRH